MRNFKKCLITGICGSGGSYLAEHIRKRDKEIKIYGVYRSLGYYNLIKKNIKKKLFLKKIDLNNFLKIKNYLNSVKPDVIFHLASNADVRESFNTPINFIKNNNAITANLLEAIRVLKLKPLVIICSSSEVYGNVKRKFQPISEKNIINPINPYAATKSFQDIVSQVYAKCFGIKIIITRMFSYTNARRSNLFQTSFALQIAKIEAKRQKYLMHGNLKSKRTFVDIDDAMEAYWLTAKKGKVNEVYNICGNKVITVKSYLDVLKRLSKVKIPCKMDKKLVRPKDLSIQIASCRKFIKHTGWKPKISFDESVKKLLNECRRKII